MANCPVCNKEHTRREDTLDCLDEAGRRKKMNEPFTADALDKRNLLILTSKYYGELPTEPLTKEDASKRISAQIIDWNCPYSVLHKMPNPDTDIPHPSKLAVAINTVTVNRRVYQCIDCLFLFTDCVVNGTPTDCKASKCVFYEDFNSKHEVLMRHVPKFQARIYNDDDYIPKPAISKDALKKLSDMVENNPKVKALLRTMAREKGLI